MPICDHRDYMSHVPFEKKQNQPWNSYRCYDEELNASGVHSRTRFTSEPSQKTGGLIGCEMSISAPTQ